ncbi:zinc finger MYM-type protein 1-like [Mya arenaria]|uniref:zinc finger MYM-type protein 1-like n=1 Tax=Mya arenaria TaxID=6604 RepID=UPI0022E731BE|nr:zinc finger MYM-type protein 1-like [Mya arenaria]
MSFFQEADPDVLKVRAQCYDGASNMSGKYRGVQALVRERSPQANYIHCKAHCLNLALVHSSNFPCVRTMMSTVQDISFLFDYSAKRLAAFVDELSRDVTTKEEMEQRTKLRTLCETRWSSRADALATFRNAFPVVVHSLETLNDDGDNKAGQYLAGILCFEFIIALIVAEHVLSSTVALTNLLQKEDNDLLHAIGEAKVVIQLMNNERNDPEVWGVLCEKATNVAAEFDIIPSRPRRAGRQNHRANPDVDTVSDYWRITLFNAFLDHLIQEMETRILSNEDRFVAQYLLPNRLPGLQDEMLPSIYAAYAPDLQHSFEAFGNEVARWRVRWNISESRPPRLQDTLRQTSKDLYPCIYGILGVLLTMPPTSASCERSFSAMKRIKNYLRSTMSTDRMSSLALLHIHKDMDVDINNVINTFASRKCRKLKFF